ncbi:hypothetical protein V6615_05620 [Oscillospiraceae bacterium PP1C4]
MEKGTFISIVALLIAIAGTIVAFAAYFKHRNCTLCDVYDDEMMEDDLSDLDYYATQVDEEPEDVTIPSTEGTDAFEENPEESIEN